MQKGSVSLGTAILRNREYWSWSSRDGAGSRKKSTLGSVESKQLLRPAGRSVSPAAYRAALDAFPKLAAACNRMSCEEEGMDTRR